jgi:Uncharacterized protein conserved in bacteria (DUF2252)
MEILVAQAASRVPELFPIRYGRMLVSPFTFYRGAAAVMAADLATTPDSGITVQACGDEGHELRPGNRPLRDRLRRQNERDYWRLADAVATAKVAALAGV